MEGKKRKRAKPEFEANQVEAERYPSCLYSLGEILDAVGNPIPLVGMRVEVMPQYRREALQIQTASERVKREE